METYLQKLRRERPELFFDGRGAALDDQAAVKKLLSDVPKDYKEKAKLALYMPVQPEPPKEEKKGVLPALERTARQVVSAIAPAPADEPSPEEDDTVGSYLRRAEPALVKASDKGLARYLKITYNLPEDLEEIQSQLNGDARGSAEFLQRVGKTSVRPDAVYGAPKPPEPVQPEEPGLLSKLTEYSTPGLLGKLYSRENIQDKTQTAESLRQAALGGFASLGGGIASLPGAAAELLDLSEEERRPLEIAARADSKVSGRGGGGRERVQSSIQEMARETIPGYVERELAKESIQDRSSKLADVLFTQAQQRIAESKVGRKDTLGKLVKRIDNAKTVEEGMSAIADASLEFVTTPESLFVLADSLASIVGGATRLPTLGIFGGSFGQRLGASLSELPEDQRQEKAPELIQGALRGATVDALTAKASIGLAKAPGPATARATGVVGLGAAGEAGGDFAESPEEFTAGKLAAGLLGGAISGPAEVGPAILQDLTSRARVQELKASPDPLDQAEAAIIEMPEAPKAADVKAPQEPVRDLLGDITDQVTKPVATEDLAPRPEIEAEKARLREVFETRRKKKADVEQAYADREFQQTEEQTLARYEQAIRSEDYVAQAKIEAELEDLYKRPEAKRQQDTSARPEPVQQELDLTGGVQPEQTVTPKPGPTASTVPPKTPKKAKAKYTQLSSDPEYTMTPKEWSTVERVAQDEGLPPLKTNEPRRTQFNKLSPAGQAKVVKELTGQNVPLEAPQKAPKPRTPVTPSATTSTVPPVQQGASQSVPADTVVRSRLETMEDGRIKSHALKLIDDGATPTQAFKQAVDAARRDKAQFNKDATALANELQFDIGDAPAAASTPTAVPVAPEISKMLERVSAGEKAKGRGDVKFTPVAAPESTAAKRANEVAQALGVETVWVDQQGGDRTYNGFTPGNSRIAVVNTKATKPVDVVLGHEANHILERKPEYKAAVQKALADFGDQTGITTIGREKVGRGYAPGKVKEEIRSDLLGEALQDPVFHRALLRAAGNPSTYRKIVDFIKDTLDRVIGKLSRAPEGKVSATALKDIKGYRAAVLKAVADAKKAPQADAKVNATKEVAAEAETSFSVEEDGDKIKTKPLSRLAATKETVADGTKAIVNQLADFARYRGRADAATAESVLRDKGNRTAASIEHERIGRELAKVAKKARVSPTELNAMLKGTKTPPEIMKHTVAMARAEIDRQSVLIAGMLGDPKQIETIRANLTTYLSKSYQAWQSPDRWARKVKSRTASTGETLWDFALRNIQENLEILSDLSNLKGPQLERMASYWDVDAGTKDGRIAALEEIRDNLTPERLKNRAELLREQLVNPTQNSTSKFISQFKSALNGTNSILKSIDTPPWVREVWGEIEDGTYNFLVTAERQAALISKIQTMDRLAAELLAKGKASFDATPGMVRVPATEANGPLAGMYINKADWEYIQGTRTVDEANQFLSTNAIARLVTSVNSVAKYNTVVLDTSSVAVQVVSSVANAAILQGRPPTPAELQRAVDTALTDVAYSKRSKESQERLREKVALRVASEGVWSGEAKTLIQDMLHLERESDAARRTDVSEYTPDALWLHFKSMVDSGSQVFTKTLQFGDTLSRAIAYEINYSDLKKWGYPDREAKEEAARRTNNTLPTLSQAAPIAKLVGRTGFINPFATFISEVHRNIYWNTVYGVSDMVHGKSTSQKMAGARRLGATGIAVAAVGTALSYVAGYLADGLRDEYEEETGQKLSQIDPELMETFAPEFFEFNAGLVPVGVDSAGVLVYLNPQRFNAQEPMWQLLQHGLEGDYNKAVEAWSDVVFSGGFLQDVGKVAVSAWDASTDKDLIRAQRKAEDAKRKLIDIVTPGALDRLVVKPERAEQRGDPMTTLERVSEASGMTVHKSNLVDGVTRSLRSWSDLTKYNREQAKQFGATAKDAFAILADSFSEIDQGKVNEVYSTWYASNSEAFQKASAELNDYAQVLSKEQIAAAAKDAGVSKDNLRRLYSGEFDMPKLVVDGSDRDMFATQMERAIKQAGTNQEGIRKAKEKWTNLKKMFLQAEREFLKNLKEGDK